MKIIAILDVTRDPHDDAEPDPPDGPALWPAGVNAITYVVTTPADTGERFVAYAIDVEAGQGLYSIAGERASLGGLFSAFERVITGVLGGGPPPPPPHFPPELLIRSGVAQHHPVIALATLRHQVVRSFEQMQDPEDRRRDRWDVDLELEAHPV